MQGSDAGPSEPGGETSIIRWKLPGLNCGTARKVRQRFSGEYAAAGNGADGADPMGETRPAKV